MNELILVAGIHLLAVMSPGPDFAVVLKTSLSGSRRSSMFVAIGIGLGIMVHVLYSIIGIAVIISQSILLFNTIKLLGAAYLVYIGIKSLRSKKREVTDEDIITKSEQKHMSDWQSFKLGFITNVLNPKATLFFLSLFTQVINPATSNWVKLLYGAEMVVVTALWFMLVGLLMTQKPMQKIIHGIKHHIERVFGVILVALGINVALGARE